MKRIGKIRHDRVVEAGSAKAVSFVRVRQPVAAVELGVAAQVASTGPIEQPPRSALRLHGGERERFRLKSQPVSAPAAIAVFEVKDILANVADEKLQRISPGVAVRAKATIERPATG